jgi:hypothetical protein
MTNVNRMNGARIGRGVWGTAWGATQAWSEFSDPHRGANPRDADARRLSIWFGKGDLEQLALDAVVAETGIQLSAAA